ncbi:MAG: hypothetical protein FJ405_07165, partial [Verrucomicrobia bacterium]|nr:hypothetical protein [Verrucomicrobiota bacterium]
MRWLSLFALIQTLAVDDSFSQLTDSEVRRFGPVYFGTVLNKSWGESSTIKGVVVKLGENDSDYVCYDQELLRLSLHWSGAFLNFPKNSREQVMHPTAAEVAGVGRFGATATPGWSITGAFDDPRPNRQGPLPKSIARYHGAHLHGNQVVLSYSVGGVRILESPTLEVRDGSSVLIRNFELGPTPQAMSVLIAEGGRPGNPCIGLGGLEAANPPPPAAASRSAFAEAGMSAVLYHANDEMTVARLLHGPGQTEWRIQNGDRLVLSLPRLEKKTRVRVACWTGGKGRWGVLRSLLQSGEAPPDLAALTQGGPPRWTTNLSTRGIVGTNVAPYQVDYIAEPSSNPWGVRNYLSALDLFPDGRAMVSSFHGDVWVVSGLDSKLDKLQWRRFAAGLFQPLGVKIVDQVPYLTCRDGIVRLRDLNGDGEADYYENFNNDTIATANYHEFCMDLDTDSAGNFYFAKGAPWPADVTSPHQGTLLKVSKDGSQLEVVATGLRAPNGLAVGPNDEVSFSDNEGHYIPTSKLSYVKPGKPFYGMVQTAQGVPSNDFEQPICWIPKLLDNSSGGQVWVKGGKWGPLEGSMLFLSYGKASLFTVMQERVDGVAQAGVVQLPFRFPTGIMRARFSPADGQLYLAGLRGWQTAGIRDGGFFRVRYTGQTLTWPVAFHARQGGLELQFTAPLKPESVQDTANWSAEQWNYVWSANYGSPEVSLGDSRVKGHDPLTI